MIEEGKLIIPLVNIIVPQHTISIHNVVSNILTNLIIVNHKTFNNTIIL